MGAEFIQRARGLPRARWINPADPGAQSHDPAPAGSKGLSQPPGYPGSTPSDCWPGWARSAARILGPETKQPAEWRAVQASGWALERQAGVAIQATPFGRPPPHVLASIAATAAPVADGAAPLHARSPASRQPPAIDSAARQLLVVTPPIPPVKGRLRHSEHRPQDDGGFEIVWCGATDAHRLQLVMAADQHVATPSIRADRTRRCP